MVHADQTIASSSVHRAATDGRKPSNMTECSNSSFRNDKFEHGCTTTNLCPTTSYLNSNSLIAATPLAQTLPFKSVTGQQTLNFAPSPVPPEGRSTSCTSISHCDIEVHARCVSAFSCRREKGHSMIHRRRCVAFLNLNFS